MFTCIVCVHWYRGSNTFSPQWPQITNRYNNSITTNEKCQTSDECTQEQVCFDNSCIPKLRRSGTCNPHTGDWVLVEKGNLKFVNCICKYPTLVTQKYEGGNCDTDVACSPDGRLENLNVDPLKSGRCICTLGYKSKYDPVLGPFCEKMKSVEWMELEGPCKEDETSSSNLFKPNYITTLPKKCFKRPCSFDVFSGKRLKYAKLVEGFGCVCDPLRGNFGVRIDHPEYLNDDVAPGYNACASIFKNEPIFALENVELFAYFYMLHRSPVAFIQYKNLDKNSLKPEFIQFNSSLQIEESWPFDYMQYVLQNENYIVHSRICYIDPVFGHVTSCDEHNYKEKHVTDCWKVTENTQNETYVTYRVDPHANIYNILYKFPVCHFDKEDYSVSKTYRDKYVLNPHQITFAATPDLLRSNGLKMYRRKNKWHADFATPYNINNYMKSYDSRIIPDLRDKISQSVGEGSWLIGDYYPRQRV